MLTVWSILWGDKYKPEAVYILRDMVARNLSEPHHFKCITEQDLPGIQTVRPPCDYPGWWQKIGLFSGIDDNFNLWLDLDVVITGSLDPIAGLANGTLACPWNWAQSGHGGCQSSVMVWGGGECEIIWNEFEPRHAIWPPENNPRQFWGDQEWITHLRDNDQLNVRQLDPALVKSYKYHCRDGPPAGCRVVVFHGKPDPDEVADEWVKLLYTRTQA